MRFVAVVLGATCVLTLLGSSPSATQAKSTPTRYVAIVNKSGDEPWAFRPTALTVRVGTRVIWRNTSSEAHTVTGTGSHPAFDSGLANQIAPKHQWSHVFRRKGTYSYYCYLHPYMKGKVIVR